MLERIQVVPAAKIHGQHEVTPEMEGRLRQLEREIARSGGGSEGKPLWMLLCSRLLVRGSFS